MSDEEEIFEQALRISEPQKRAEFLDRACADQPQLRVQIEKLLDAHEQTSGILESPVVQVIDGPPSEQPGSLVGNYKLLEQIGEGGMGVVYMAEQLRPVKRRVALKILKPGLDTRQVIARFEAERQALAMMDHPNIAHVFDAGVTETGRPYFAMELVRGIPITQFCDQDRLTPRQRLELFVQVCQAVQHAHQKGIIHRDLKPTNVLVTLADDGKPVSKIIDFGIAKAIGGQRLVDQTLFTEFRQLIGTPLYMSPEQAEMSPVMDVDTRSDVYSLGVLLYELLTGTTPFDKKRLGKAAHDEVRRIIRDEEPPRPSTRISSLGDTLTMVSAQRRTDPKKLRAIVRGELDWIVMRALEKDRGRRYATASGFAMDVERFLADQPVEACPPSRVYWVRKFARRNKAVIMTASIIATVLILATFTSMRQARRATLARALAEAQQKRADDQTVIAIMQAAAAERQLQRAEAFNQVMRGILSNVHPTRRSTGQDLRVVDLLNLAAREAEIRFKLHPEAEIESRMILADAYRGLDYNQARENLRKAYELSRNLPDGANSEQTLGLAADLAFYSDAEFAEKTYEAALKRLGQWHPISQRAASGLAAALLNAAPEEVRRRDLTARAEQLLRGLVDHANQSIPPESTPAVYDNLHSLAILLDKEHKYVEAEKLSREALTRAKADPTAGVTVQGLMGFALVDALAGQGRLREAADAAGETLAYDLANIGAFHPATTQLLQVYARLLCRIGRADEADQLLDDNLRLARAVYPGDDESTVDRIAALGHLRLDMEHREDALPLLIEGAKMQSRLHGTDGKARVMAREALLVSLGATHQPADGTIRTQLLCALEDLWRDNPALTPEDQDVAPSNVRYSLIRWDPSIPVEVCQGTLAEPAPKEPGPGMYLLSLEVPTRGGGVLRQAMWVLIARWNVMFRALDEIGAAADGAPLAAISENAIGQVQVPAIAIINDLKGFPEKSAEFMCLSAQASLDLPAGRYRASATSGDGIRLFIDGKRVINAWSTHRPRRDFCDLELGQGRHELRLDYFQEGRRALIWLRIEPISAESAAFAASHGGHALRTLQRAIEEQGESRCAQASATRAGLYATLGRWNEAVNDYAAAIEIYPEEALWWQQSALLRLVLDDQRGYLDWRQRMLGRVMVERDMAARGAIVVMLGDHTSPQDQALLALLKVAQTNTADEPDGAICLLAQGICAYRSGNYELAISALGDAASGRLNAEARTSAQVFRAMALHQQGSVQESLKAWTAARKAIAAFPTAEQAELDATEIEDRLICQLAAREAQGMFDRDH